MNCIGIIPIFLLFYFTTVSGRPQVLDDFDNDLSTKPFLLDSGEIYRDLFTITAARNVGQFGVSRDRSTRGCRRSRRKRHGADALNCCQHQGLCKGHSAFFGPDGASTDIAVAVAGLSRVRSKVSATRGVPRTVGAAPGDRESDGFEGR